MPKQTVGPPAARVRSKKEKHNVPVSADIPVHLPHWPAFTARSTLTLTTLVPHHVFTVADLLSPSTCQALVRTLEGSSVSNDGAITHTLQFVTSNPVPQRGHAIRHNARLAFHDPQLARDLWTRTGLSELLTAHLPRAPDLERRILRGLNPNIRIYRYRPGQKFERHYDESVRVPRICLGLPPLPPPEPSFFATEFTLLVYLTGSSLSSPSAEFGGTERLTGGETVFFRDLDEQETEGKRKKKPKKKDTSDVVLASVDPVIGMALLHRHGSKCLLHEGKEVLTGVKYVLRSDILFE